MLITVEIPDALAGLLHSEGKADARALLEALVLQRHAEGKLTASQVGEVLGIDSYAVGQFLEVHQETPTNHTGGDTKRPRRDVMARLRSIYGDVPLTGENAVLAARRMERY